MGHVPYIICSSRAWLIKLFLWNVKSAFWAAVLRKCCLRWRLQRQQSRVIAFEKLYYMTFYKEIKRKNSCKEMESYRNTSIVFLPVSAKDYIKYMSNIKSQSQGGSTNIWNQPVLTPLSTQAPLSWSYWALHFPSYIMFYHGIQHAVLEWDLKWGQKWLFFLSFLTICWTKSTDTFS